MSIRFPVRLVILAGFVLSAGCGSRRGSLDGEVTYLDKGERKPLPSGRVTFYPEGKPEKACSAEVSDGKFSLPSCLVGPCKVTVETFRRGGTMDLSKLPPEVAKSMEGFKEQHEAVGKNHVFVPIPLRYARPETTDLSCEVRSGSQSVTFELLEK